MDLLSYDPVPPVVNLLGTPQATERPLFDRIQGIRSWLSAIESLAQALAQYEAKSRSC